MTSGTHSAGAKKFRLALVGSVGVGKTSIVEQLISAGLAKQVCDDKNRFQILMSVTFDGIKVSLSILDTPGAHGHDPHTIFDMRRFKPDAIVLVFSLVSRRTFNALPHRLQLIKNFTSVNSDWLLLLGNKTDLLHQKQPGPI
uniref:AIG1-type G domain-containing protein n=1 Tax=Macrostomum lignano TaxID=282301 RepID=A0A1I8G6Y0_9PLAT